MQQPRQARLFGIEAIRGVAASVVVLYHIARHLNKNSDASDIMKWLQFGHAGVDMFFVLSGFIIYFIHATDVGQPASVKRYLSRRFTRLVPIYWVALGATVVLSAKSHAIPSLMSVLWSATLLPSVQEPVLATAWTLQHEFMFYAAFCVLITNRVIGLLVMCCWLAWIAAVAIGVPDFVGLGSTFNLLFFIGMGTAYLMLHNWIRAPAVVLVTGMTLLTCACLGENFSLFNGYSNFARLLYGIPTGLIIAGIGALDRAGRLSVPGFLRTLGAASYSIYLFQFVFIGLAWQAWIATGLIDRAPTILTFGILALSGLMGGIAIHRWVELPLLAFVRMQSVTEESALGQIRSLIIFAVSAPVRHLDAVHRALRNKFKMQRSIAISEPDRASAEVLPSPIVLDVAQH
jgi:exopolysaccharide production protein ExoZ